MDSADASSAEFDAKKAALQLVGDEIIARAKELTRRPAAVAKARAQLADSVAKLAELAVGGQGEAARGPEGVRRLDEKEQLQAKKPTSTARVHGRGGGEQLKPWSRSSRS